MASVTVVIWSSGLGTKTFGTGGDNGDSGIIGGAGETGLRGMRSDARTAVSVASGAWLAFVPLTSSR
jgi:hypothetical protein